MSLGPSSTGDCCWQISFPACNAAPAFSVTQRSFKHITSQSEFNQNNRIFLATDSCFAAQSLLRIKWFDTEVKGSFRRCVASPFKSLKINLYRPSLPRAVPWKSHSLSVTARWLKGKPWHGLSLQRRNWFGLAEIIPSRSAGVPSLTWTGAEWECNSNCGSLAGLSHSQRSTYLLECCSTNSKHPELQKRQDYPNG